MRTWMVTVLLFAGSCFGQDYPAPAGFVNDFAGQLKPQATAALEKKVRDYQSATGNQIAVAIVPSLHNMLVDDYARGLFHAWGVGERGRDNGVLFVWAPRERRIRIEAGTGLEGVVTDARAGQILEGVRELFRRREYAAGVNAAVDGIIAVLGQSRAAAGPSVPELSESTMQGLQRQHEEAVRQQAAADRAARRAVLDGLAVAAGMVAAAYLLFRRWRAGRWNAKLPAEFADAQQLLDSAGGMGAEARAALGLLQKEAPEEVWRDASAGVDEVSANLTQKQASLHELQMASHDSYGELKRLHKGLRMWRDRMEADIGKLRSVSHTLETFRGRKAEAGRLLESIPVQLERVRARGDGERADELLKAASETFAQAQEKSKEQPANWLLIYDLLADVQACLEQIENPAARTRYRPERFWIDDDGSAAAMALMTIFEAQAVQTAAAQAAAGSQSRGPDFWGGPMGGDGGGGFSGGSGDAGGFGGGDTSGGGASSDY